MSTIKLAPLFVNRDMVVRQTYDRLVKMLERYGEVIAEPQKDSVTFIGAGPFMAALPLQSQLRVSILSTAPIDNPRIRKCTRFAPGRYYNQVDLKSPWEIDDELLEWIKTAFQLVEADAAQAGS